MAAEAEETTRGAVQRRRGGTLLDLFRPNRIKGPAMNIFLDGCESIALLPVSDAAPLQ